MIARVTRSMVRVSKTSKKSSTPITPVNTRRSSSSTSPITPVNNKRSSSSTSANLRTPPKKRKKKYVKLPPLTPLNHISKAPPKAAGDWLKTYNLVLELRQDRTAPVDLFGSEALSKEDQESVSTDVFEFQTLVALMLSSQTKDPMVGKAMKSLKAGLLNKGGLSVEGVMKSSIEEIKDLIYGVGFHNNKSKYIINSATMIHEDYNGKVPASFHGLCSLPGVGPKMAMIVMDVAFDKCLGVSIDTHLHRMLGQLHWTKNSKNPEDTRIQLETWLPREYWQDMNLEWVGLGQEIRESKGKLLKKVLKCSDVTYGMKMLVKFGIDVKKVAREEGLELP